VQSISALGNLLQTNVQQPSRPWQIRAFGLWGLDDDCDEGDGAAMAIGCGAIEGAAEFAAPAPETGEPEIDGAATATANAVVANGATTIGGTANVGGGASVTTSNGRGATRAGGTDEVTVLLVGAVVVDEVVIDVGASWALAGWAIATVGPKNSATQNKLNHDTFEEKSITPLRTPGPRPGGLKNNCAPVGNSRGLAIDEQR
jgi:hypothetical protein